MNDYGIVRWSTADLFTFCSCLFGWKKKASNSRENNEKTFCQGCNKKIRTNKVLAEGNRLFKVLMYFNYISHYALYWQHWTGLRPKHHLLQADLKEQLPKVTYSNHSGQKRNLSPYVQWVHRFFTTGNILYQDSLNPITNFINVQLSWLRFQLISSNLLLL